MGDYITTTDVAEFLQTDIPDDEGDLSTLNKTAVDKWIAWAEAEVDQAAKASFTTSQESTVYFSGNGGVEYWIPPEYRPLVSIADLQVNTGSTFSPTWSSSKTEGTDYLIINTTTGHLKFSPAITIKAMDYAFRIGTLTYGYSVVPELVKELALKLVVMNYIKSALGNTSVTTNESIQVGPIRISNNSANSVSYVRELKEDIKELKREVRKLTAYTY